MVDKSKKELLILARESLEERICFKPSGIWPKIKDLPEFSDRVGVFVTLQKNGKLRGCIGDVDGHMTIAEAVRVNVVKSALEDPRFPKVKEDELDDIDIEISLLGKPERLPYYDYMRLGEDGIIITCDYRRALFLPQVAIENEWDEEEMMINLCRKAGLPLDSYTRRDAIIEAFKVEYFSEKSLGISKK